MTKPAPTLLLGACLAIATCPSCRYIDTLGEDLLAGSGPSPCAPDSEPVSLFVILDLTSMRSDWREIAEPVLHCNLGALGAGDSVRLFPVVGVDARRAKPIFTADLPTVGGDFDSDAVAQRAIQGIRADAIAASDAYSAKPPPSDHTDLLGALWRVRTDRARPTRVLVVSDLVNEVPGVLDMAADPISLLQQDEVADRVLAHARYVERPFAGAEFVFLVTGDEHGRPSVKTSQEVVATLVPELVRRAGGTVLSSENYFTGALP